MLRARLGGVRIALAALLFVVALAPGLLLAGPARAAACGGDTGVSVVVQFPDGRTVTGCAPGDPATGLAALQGAGFSYAFDSRNPGFVCKISGAPADGQCMKPDYWAYYHDTGRGWAYSGEGAATYDPPAGSTEGWRFGTGQAPGVRAPAGPVRTPSAAPTRPSGGGTAPTRHSGGDTTASPRATTSSSSNSATPSASPSATPSASRSRAPRSTPSAAGTATSGATSGPSSDPARAARAAGEQSSAVADDSGSGSLSWVWGVGLLGLVAAERQFQPVAAVARVLPVTVLPTALHRYLTDPLYRPRAVDEARDRLDTCAALVRRLAREPELLGETRQLRRLDERVRMEAATLQPLRGRIRVRRVRG